MDWKRLVQFTLQGSSDLEQYAILLMRVPAAPSFAVVPEIGLLWLLSSVRITRHSYDARVAPPTMREVFDVQRAFLALHKKINAATSRLAGKGRRFALPGWL